MVSDNILMSISELTKAVGGDLYQGDTGVSGFSSVSIDSRAVLEGSLFVALLGETCDGHAFVEAAFSKGAAVAMVERRKCEAFDMPAMARALGNIVAVDDTLQGLQDAARVYLERFPGLLKIGITGSSGKTTTKEIAAAIIGAEKNTVASRGNYNSDTGLPLSVFEVRSHHEVGVFELGMNRKGEMAGLAAVLKPHIALITNVGSAHIGLIGSRQGIAKEKKAIFSQLDENGIALVPEDSDFRDFLAEGVRGRVSFYGEKSLAEFGGARSLGLDGSEIVWGGEGMRFALPGKHNIANAVSAIAIAREVPVSARAIKKGLDSVKPMFGRGEILRGRATVIRDCYNSNPESLAEAVGFCDDVEWPGRRVYVIGEMLELGDVSREAHEDAGRLLSESKADVVYLFGKETAATAAVMDSCVSNGAAGAGMWVFHTCDMDELIRAANADVRKGDLVLLKGSRGCALERLCEIFEEGVQGVSGNL